MVDRADWRGMKPVSLFLVHFLCQILFDRQNEWSEAFWVWQNVSLLFCRYLEVEIEHPPSYGHHFCFSLVDDTILNVNDGMLSSAEDWCVLVKNNVLGVVCFRSRKMNKLSPALKGSHARKWFAETTGNYPGRCIWRVQHQSKQMNYRRDCKRYCN